MVKEYGQVAKDTVWEARKGWSFPWMKKSDPIYKGEKVFEADRYEIWLWDEKYCVLHEEMPNKWEFQKRFLNLNDAKNHVTHSSKFMTNWKAVSTKKNPLKKVAKP